MTARRICLVTPEYLSSTPRVVREADALVASGHDVRVVFTQGPLEELRAFDRDLIQRRPWRAVAFRWSPVHPRERAAYRLSGFRHRLAQRLSPGVLEVPGIAERGEGRAYPELADLAAAEPADLFIGHYPTGLAAAAYAARCHRARLGYDIEDLYADTFPESAFWRRPRARIVTLERRYVPMCLHLTAASQPMADAFANRYGTDLPVVVHNCHPWAERAALDGRVLDRAGQEVSLFWFSQTVGLDRGLQDAIVAVGRQTPRIHLHIRGRIDERVRATLTAVAAAVGAADRLHFHPPCAPEALLSRAAEHDIGLALETGASLNRQVTVTNKLFTYLTAGLAVAASDLPGQRGIAVAAPAAIELYPPGDVDGLQRVLARWTASPQRLAAAKAAALEAARVRWNAEAEGARIVAAVRSCFSRRATPARVSV